MEPTPRLTRRIRADVRADETGLVVSALDELSGLPAVGSGERVQTANVKLSGGERVRFDHALEEARRDWCDVLVAVGIEHDDWRERLDDDRGPMEAPA